MSEILIRERIEQLKARQPSEDEWGNKFIQLSIQERRSLLAYIRALEAVAVAAKEHNSDVCPEDTELVAALAALDTEGTK